MIRVKDIANMVGVSPTTVSNGYSRKYKEGIRRKQHRKSAVYVDEVGYIP